jgi:hypothetical protein
MPATLGALGPVLLALRALSGTRPMGGGMSARCHGFEMGKQAVRQNEEKPSGNR